MSTTGNDWRKALAVPVIWGLTVGVGLLALRYMARGSCDPEFGCAGLIILLWIVGPLFLLIVGGAVLKAAGTPRAWGIAAVSVGGGVILSAVAHLLTLGTASRQPLVLVLLPLLAYLWGALVAGPLLSMRFRLVVLIGLLVTLPVSGWANGVLDKMERRQKIDAVPVVLLAPQVPGYQLSPYPYTYNDAVFLSLAPVGAPTDYARTILIEGSPIPAGFRPPDRCGRELSHDPVELPCTQLQPEVWIRTGAERTTFLVRHGDSLYQIYGQEEVPAEAVRQAALSLHPVTSRELIP